jgi:hypothetical protein
MCDMSAAGSVRACMPVEAFYTGQARLGRACICTPQRRPAYLHLRWPAAAELPDRGGWSQSDACTNGTGPLSAGCQARSGLGVPRSVGFEMTRQLGPGIDGELCSSSPNIQRFSR